LDKKQIPSLFFVTFDIAPLCGSSPAYQRSAADRRHHGTAAVKLGCKRCCSRLCNIYGNHTSAEAFSWMLVWSACSCRKTVTPACELATISYYVTRRHPSVIQLLQPLHAAAVCNKSYPANLSASPHSLPAVAASSLVYVNEQETARRSCNTKLLTR